MEGQYSSRVYIQTTTIVEWTVDSVLTPWQLDPYLVRTIRFSRAVEAKSFDASDFPMINTLSEPGNIEEYVKNQFTL